MTERSRDDLAAEIRESGELMRDREEERPVTPWFETHWVCPCCRRFVRKDKTCHEFKYHPPEGE